MTESILVVCAGNVCRSPYVERLLGAEPALGRLDISVTSRGTAALEGYPIAPRMAKIMTREGLSLHDFAARPLSVTDLQTATLILTADRRQRAIVARRLPLTLGRLFTVRQLGRLLSGPDFAGSAGPDPRHAVDGPLLRLVTAAAAARGVYAPSAGTADDVPDPWTRPARVYEHSARLLRGATGPLIRSLRQFVSPAI